MDPRVFGPSRGEAQAGRDRSQWTAPCRRLPLRRDGSLGTWPAPSPAPHDLRPAPALAAASSNLAPLRRPRLVRPGRVSPRARTRGAAVRASLAGKDALPARRSHGAAGRIRRAPTPGWQAPVLAVFRAEHPDAGIVRKRDRAPG